MFTSPGDYELFSSIVSTPDDVFRAITKAAGVLNEASDMIPLAMELNPYLKSELQLYEAEISRSKEVMDLIRHQAGLQTSGVVAGIRMLQSHSELLIDNLMCLDDKDGEELKKMLDIFRAKRRALALQIRLASVGLTKADGAIIIQPKVVLSTDQAVKKILGKDSGLVIASFLANLNRVPASGKIRLNDREYEKLTLGQIQTSHPETKTVTTEVKTRIICNGLARGQSIQILGPVAVDLWAGIAFIKIEGLVAMDQAIQFGYPVSWEVFQEGLDRQEQRIASSRVKELRA